MNIEQAKTAVRSVQNASHAELSSLTSSIAALFNRSGCLSEACKALVVDELDDLADRVDADLVAQQMAAAFDNRQRKAA